MGGLWYCQCPHSWRRRRPAVPGGAELQTGDPGGRAHRASRGGRCKMAEQTEPKVRAIEHELDETRADLADKLAQLSDKITGTVETVEETVENVTEKAAETVEAVKETVAGTVESVKESVETVRETVSGTVENVKESVSTAFENVRETFNLQRQMQERPWLVLGGAVAVGFIGGKLVDAFTASGRPSFRGRSYGGDYSGRRAGNFRTAFPSEAESTRP